MVRAGVLTALLWSALEADAGSVNYNGHRETVHPEREVAAGGLSEGSTAKLLEFLCVGQRQERSHTLNLQDGPAAEGSAAVECASLARLALSLARRGAPRRSGTGAGRPREHDLRL